jgi:RNA recognition motif-containing protein
MPASLAAISKSLILSRIPRRYTEDDLKTLFNDFFGEVRDVYCPLDQSTGRKHRYAFIEFKRLEDAIKCYKQINSEAGILLDGVILRVDYARNGRQSPNNMRDKWVSGPLLSDAASGICDRMPSVEVWEECAQN